MPQKKNPDALELIRGKSARIQGNLMTLLSLVRAQPLTYNRDLQEDKPPVFDALDQFSACLGVLTEVIAGLGFRGERLAEAVSDPLLLATDLADWLVEQGGPFRDAHHLTGKLVAVSESTGTPLHELSDADVTEVHPVLSDPSWRAVFDLDRAADKRRGFGMPGTLPLDQALVDWAARLA
jgi:argininosuccinate lyase